ncbi:MAG: AarF/UbiB family protein [Terriglobales bacterium]
MLDLAFAAAQLRNLTPDQLRAALSQFLPQGSRDERIAAIESTLQGPAGQILREEMARWIVDHAVPVDALVPRQYEHLRPLVRDAMQFEVLRLSPHRLAPKLVEQIEVSSNTSPETRLLLLISKVPGLQKLGQVLARNRQLKPSLRNALSKLENGIRDVKAVDIRAVIERELGPKLQTYCVKISSSILSEASVSAVMRFTWRDPDTGERHRGVFKVLKPHIPECFAEDMDLLHHMAHYLGAKHREYGYAPRVIQDTFKKVRQLLEHEVDFTGEQHTLAKAGAIYRQLRGIAVPRPFPHLSTPVITAMTEQPGVKVTSAARRLKPSARTSLAERLTESLIAAPLCAPAEDALFHGDPHAGNLLFDTRTGTLSLIDWALTEHLTADQRRHLALLVAMVALRNAAAVCHEIHALSQHPIRGRQAAMVRRFVTEFLEGLPLMRPPQLTEPMQLLERISLKGVRFPASLIMFSKMMFTLDGILEDIKGDNSIAPRVAHNFVKRWLSSGVRFGSPLRPGDWIHLGVNTAIYGSRIFVQWERDLFSRYTGLALAPA